MSDENKNYDLNLDNTESGNDLNNELLIRISELFGDDTENGDEASSEEIADLGDLASQLEAVLDSSALSFDDADRSDIYSESEMTQSDFEEAVSADTELGEFHEPFEEAQSDDIEYDTAREIEPEGDDDLEELVNAYAEPEIAEEALNFGETDEGSESADDVESVDPSDISEPVDIDAFDFNTAEDDAVGVTDMNLRIAFGLEEDDEASDEVRDAVRKFGDRLESNPRVGIKYQSEHPEYTDPIQAREIAAEYRSRKHGVSWRLFFAVIFTLALLVFENISTLTSLTIGKSMQFAGVLDGTVYPVVYIMVSLQLLLFTALCALPELKRGIVRLFRGVPTPGSLAAFLLAAGIVCSAVSAAGAQVMVMPSVYNAVPAAAIVMTLIASRLNIKREMKTFYVAGSKKKKYALSRVPDDEAYREIESEEELYGDVMRVERTGFVDNFFARCATPDRMTNTFIASLMGLAAACAILFGIFSVRRGSSITDVADVIYLAIIALSPLSVYLTFSYPIYRAASAAAESDCAIIGEESLDEYSSTALVSFDDVNVFPSYGVKVQNIRIYNNARIDRVLYYASSAFHVTGGPLSDVFEIATLEMGRSDDVELLDADAGLLDAKVDGVRITFGSYTALTSRGYDIPEETAMDDVDFSDELSIMYMFREDVLIAKMYIKYVLDGDIEHILSQFREYGMLVCVRTYDPNIDEDMIASKLSMKDAPIRVIRYRSADDVGGHSERTDSGFVTYGSPKALLQLLPYCDKTIHTKRTCAALSIMSVIISLMLLVIFGMSSGMGAINSLYIIAYNIAWIIPAYLASKIFIR